MERNNKNSIFYMIRKTVPTVLKASKWDFVWFTLIDILHGCSFGVNVVITQMLFDTIQNATNKEALAGVIWVALGLGGVQIINQFLNGASNYYEEFIKNKVLGKLNVQIQKKAKNIQAIEFENTKRLDDINKAVEGAAGACEFVQVLLSLFSFYVPYFLFMAFYMFSQKPDLILCILFVFLPIFFGQLLRTKIYAQLADESAPVKREIQEYEKALSDPIYLKETRILGAFSYFRNLLLNSVRCLNQSMWKANKKTTALGFLLNTVSLIGYLAILGLLISAVMSGDITIGAFAAIFSSIETMFLVMEEIVCENFGNLSKDAGVIMNFLNFFEIPERSEKMAEPTGSDIVFEQVGFKYPNAKESTIEGMNLRIKDGETVAIVGMNGAGKSTLVKLMMGIYVPTKGTVFVKGLDTKSVHPTCIYKLYSSVFQKFIRYKLTLQDNVQISDYRKEADIDTALKMADVNMEKDVFADGKETMLSREFDGVDLSGGEWQRVAIARAYYKEHSMIVLDEPTAAIDPIEESKLYQKFYDISKGKTSIIVTHRLGSAKIADRILLMGNGKILEQGTHEELMRKNGIYKDMWVKQASWYERV